MQEILFIPIPVDRLKLEISEAIKLELNKHHSSSSLAQPLDELLSRTETARLLGISLPTLHAWTKSGIIKAYRIGSRIRYKKAEIESSLKQIKAGNKI